MALAGRMARGAVASVLALVASSVVAPAVADGGLGGSGSLAGLVSNAVTDAPVSGACVAAVQGNTVVTTANTASDGQYTISNLAPGLYVVVTCLTTTTLANERAPRVVKVVAGQTARV